MLITCTRCVEFSYLICGFQGSDMCSNHTRLVREHVSVSIACEMVRFDLNCRLSEFRYQTVIITCTLCMEVWIESAVFMARLWARIMLRWLESVCAWVLRAKWCVWTGIVGCRNIGISMGSLKITKYLNPVTDSRPLFKLKRLWLDKVVYQHGYCVQNGMFGPESSVDKKFGFGVGCNMMTCFFDQICGFMAQIWAQILLTRLESRCAWVCREGLCMGTGIVGCRNSGFRANIT
jgi:hypothetical protein